MTDTADDSHDAARDDELARTLRRADPASLLPPLDPEQRRRLLEDVMTEQLTTDPHRTPAPTTRNRRRNALIGIAAGVVIIGGGATWALSGGSAAPARQPTALSMAAVDPMAMCAVSTPQIVGQATLAFEGTVTSIENGVVTLQNSHTFKGDVAPTVTVAQGTGSVVDGAPVTFTAGTTYLVAAGPDGVIGGCGPSGPTSPELRSLFDQAFGG